MNINSDLKMTALESADEIVSAISVAGSDGITMLDGALLIGVGYNEFYGVATCLDAMGVLKIVRRGCNRIRLVSLQDAYDYVAPLSPWQEKVLEFLCERADENCLVRASFMQIGRAIGHVSAPSASIDALDKKGFLEIMDKGGWDRARLYKVWKDGDGPRGWSAVWFGHPPRDGIKLPALSIMARYLGVKEEDNADSV